MAASGATPQVATEQARSFSELQPDDLFYRNIVRSYVDAPRFVRRDWLAGELTKLLKRTDCRFVLLTAEPGAGKSSFLAQLASDNPTWLVYFIRKNQRESMGELSTKSFLLRIGFQLAVLFPEAFNLAPVQIEVEQDLRKVGDAIGAQIEKVSASPFHKTLIRIRQQVQKSQGSITGIRIGELINDPQLLEQADLQELALLRPARALLRLRQSEQIVILVDALDELVYHGLEHDVLDWLTNSPPLPENVRIVLTSRPTKGALSTFTEKQSCSLLPLSISPADVRVTTELRTYVEKLVCTPDVTAVLAETERVPEDFVKQAVEKADGNIGYLVALGRAIDASRTKPGGQLLLKELLALKQLPDDMPALFEFFLHQIMNAKAAGKRPLVVQGVPGINAWTAVFRPILKVLTVAREPLTVFQLQALAGTLADQDDVIDSLHWLDQFLDTIGSAYRLYHATLADFLTDNLTKENANTQDLYVDPVTMHRQIVDYYWKCFSADWTRCDDRYGLNQLAAHLAELGDYQRLRQLLSEQWMNARFRQSYPFGYTGFMTDIDYAWNITLNQAQKRERIVELIRLQLARLLTRTQIGVASDVDLQALARLGRKNEAVAQARARTDAHDKCRGLLAIYKTLGELGQADPAIIDEAEATARAEVGEDRQVGSLAQVAVAINPIDRKRSETIMAQARRLAINRYWFERETMGGVSDWGRWGEVALADVATTLLQLCRYTDAWDIANLIRDDRLKTRVITSLVRDSGVGDSSLMASTISDNWQRNEALLAIVAALCQRRDYSKAEQLARSISEVDQEVKGLCLVAVAVNSEHSTLARTLLDDAGTLARSAKNDTDRAKALCYLADAHARVKRYADAERICREIVDARYQLEALLLVATAQAQAEEAGADHILAAAAEAVVALNDEPARNDGFRALVDTLLQTKRYSEAEQVAIKISSDYMKASAFRVIGEALAAKGDSKAYATIGWAIDSAQAVKDKRLRAVALLELGETLADRKESRAVSVLEEAWHGAADIDDTKERMDALSKTVFALSRADDKDAYSKLTDLLKARRTASTDADPSIEKVANVLIASAIPIVALPFMTLIRRPYDRVLSLCNLAAALLGSGNMQVMDVLNNAVRSVSQVDDDREKAEALCQMTEVLTRARDIRGGMIFEEACNVIKAIDDADYRVRQFSRLGVALHVTGDDMASVAFGNAQRSSEAIDSPSTRNSALAVLGEDFAKCGFYKDAEDTAAAISDSQLKSQVLVHLVIELVNAGFLERAEEVAHTVDDAFSQISALINIAQGLTEHQNSKATAVLDEILSRAEEVDEYWIRGPVLREVGRYLAQVGDLRGEGVFMKAKEAIEKGEDAEQKAYELIDLGEALHDVNSDLSNTVFQEAFSAAEDIMGTHLLYGADEIPMKGDALRALAATLARCGRFEESKHVLHAIEDDDRKADALREYAGALAAAGRSEADAAFEEAEQQIRRMSDYGSARSASHELAITLIRSQGFERARNLVDMFQLKEFIDATLEVIPDFESAYPGIAVQVLQGLSGVCAWVMPPWRQIYETLSGAETS